MAERLRWLLAWFGILLWLALLYLAPWHAMEAGRASWAATCMQRVVPLGSDPCFSDYIPVFETFFQPMITAAAGLPIAVLAFSLFAPVPERRTLKWQLAFGNDSDSGVPARPIIGGCCVALAVFMWSRLPWNAGLAALHVYWSIVTAWLLAGIAIRLLDSRQLRTDAII